MPLFYLPLILLSGTMRLLFDHSPRSKRHN